jgi:uncharacterized protein YecE (DUF72 family)
MDRDQLKELRPLIPSALTENTKEIEHFQNEVLRPILKFQHTFFEYYFKNNSQFLKLIQEKKSRLEFQNKISQFISNQANIKHQLIGSVIGMLVDEELNYYHANHAELNKRISQMVCQRISDTFY